MKIDQVSQEMIRSIRDHINRIEKRVKLLENRKKRLRLTASHVLEDSICAIEYYAESNYPSDIKGKYLYTYGLLQGLFVQQDAIKGISVALFDKSIDFKNDYPDAYAVRELRNDVMHPIDNNNGKQFVYLVQHTMHKEFFEYHIQAPSEEFTYCPITVNVEKSINDTSKCVNKVLSTVVSELDNEFQNFKNSYKETKMKEIFNTLDYAREKVLRDDIFKPTGYASTKTMVAKCEAELINRYGAVERVDCFAYVLDKIHMAHDLIDNGIQQIPMSISAKTEQCILEYLFDRMQELKDLCAEEDESLEN